MAEEQSEIKISYETLYELLRREKYRNEIQKLPENFFKDVIDFLEEKKKHLRKHDVDLINITEQSKVKQQFDNVVKILTELYDRREKKIMMVALNKARTNSLVDMSNLLPEEQQLLESLVLGLEQFRKGILHSVLQGNMPALMKPQKEEESSRQDTVKDSQKQGDEESTGKDANGESAKDTRHQEEDNSPAKRTKQVKFKQPVPKFVGEELEVYGPYEEEDVASLPSEIADLLLRKDKVVEVQE